MDTFLQLHSQLNSLVWGPPMMILLIGAGIVLTVATRGVQFRRLPFAMREATLAHAGEALAARQAFEGLAALDQARVIEFLKSLQVLPPGTKFLLVDEKWA